MNFDISELPKSKYAFSRNFLCVCMYVCVCVCVGACKCMCVILSAA